MNSMTESFSERELEILKALAEGLSNHEIADKLFLAPNTVKWYVRQLNSKLNTSNRDEIIEVAESMGLLNGEKPVLTVRHNLPYQSSPFVGRDAELDELHGMLCNPELRLLTILAQGGMGKTRIALEAAEQQIHQFQHGVYFVPLQPLSDVSQIVPQIASTMAYQFQEKEKASDKEQLLTFLGNKKMLLLIDNWEHLLEGTAIISEILQAAPKVKILTTSREKLNLSGETVYLLHGMKFPTWESPADALQYDAVRLLVQAAKRVKPDFEVTHDNLDFVSRVCRLTEGMPLGILLAVAWLDVLSLEEIAAEIQKSTDFLETRMRDVPERQRSIRAIFETAWRYLAPSEQNVFMKMAVFRGGYSRQAAEEITGANLRDLQSLVNKALLIRRKDERFEIHELLRQFAEQALNTSGCEKAVKDAHASYYTQMMHRRESWLMGDRQIEALRDIELDFENVRSAWHWALDKRDWQCIQCIFLSFTLFCSLKRRYPEWKVLSEMTREACSEKGEAEERRVWAAVSLRLTSNDYLPENISKVETSIEIAYQAENSIEIVYGLMILSSIHDIGGNPELAWHLVEKALEVARSVDDKYSQVDCLMQMAYLATGRMNNSTLGGEVILQALQIAREIKNHSLTSEALHHYAVFLMIRRDYAGALKAFEEALNLWRQLGAFHLARGSMTNIVNMNLIQGNIGLAEDYAHQTIEQAEHSNNKIHIAWARFGLVHVRMYQSRYAEALVMMEEIYQTYGTLTGSRTIAAKNDFFGTIYCGLGDYEKAASLIYAALPEVIRNFEGFGLVRSAFNFAYILVYRENLPEYALELAASVSENPFATFWKADPLVPKLISHLQSNIAPERYAEIWEAGKSIDLRERMKQIFEEVAPEEKPDAV